MPSIAGGAGDAPVDLDGSEFARAQAESDVVGNVHVGIERVVLKYHGDIAIARPVPGNIPAADLDAAVTGVFEPGDGAQEGRLAAAGRADQHRELARGDFEIDTAHGMESAVVLVQTGNLQIGHRLTP